MDAVGAVARDQVAGARCRPADRIARGIRQVNPVLVVVIRVVGQAEGARRIGADVVARDEVAGRAVGQLEVLAAVIELEVAGDQVAVRWRTYRRSCYPSRRR